MESTSEAPVLNHFGHCVTDLDRSVRFYCELFGFSERRRITLPDQPAGRLLGINEPVGLTAVYLDKGGTILELLAFDRPGNPAARARAFNEPGLTHMSFCVPDMAETKSEVLRLGGQIVDETDLGMAVMVRDPDGQIIELLAMELRQSM